MSDDFIKVGIGLKSPIWQEGHAEEIITQALQKVAARLERVLQENLLVAERTGIKYRVNLTGQKQDTQPKRVPVGKRRPYRKLTPSAERKKYTLLDPHSRNYNPNLVEIQASAEGESPALRTRRLLNAISVIVVKGKGVSVRVNAPMAGAFDDPQRFNRPFIRAIALRFQKEEFTPAMREAIKEIIGGK
jgi:hypothetical protein